MAQVEVIDLTTSPRSIINVDEEDEQNDIPETPGVEGAAKARKRKHRRRKRKSELSKEGEEMDELAEDGEENVHAKERVNGDPTSKDARRKRKRGRESDAVNANGTTPKRHRSSSPQAQTQTPDLPVFIIDFEPGTSELTSLASAIPPPSLDPPSEPAAGPATATSKHTVQDGLLLPVHVSVAIGGDLPVPSKDVNGEDIAPEDDDASGIDFLDDDRAAVCIMLLLFKRLCVDVF